MSNFESSSSELVAGGAGESGEVANKRMSPLGVANSGSGGGAPREDSTPLSAEEARDVMSDQPTGAVPSAEEMEDRRDAQSSADNLLPTDKLENGLKHARMLLATGWTSFASSVRELEQTETVSKIKEGTVTVVDRSMDGLSKVGSKVAEVTDRGVQAVGAKIDEAAPTVGRWRDEVVIASERGFAAAKEMTDKAIAEIKKPGGSNGGAGGTTYGEGTWGGSSGGDGGNTGSANEDGPHTV